jgi:hypothetical protein
MGKLFPDNEVRIIDLFVERLSIKDYGFRHVRSIVDAKHNIPIDYKVTNENDTKAMGNMVQKAKSILQELIYRSVIGHWQIQQSLKSL